MNVRFLAVLFAVSFFGVQQDLGAADPVRVGKLPAAFSGEVTYQKDIAPLFRQRCYSCHGSEQQEAGLRLDSKQRALEGGDSGKAMISGRSDESLLIQMVAGLDKERGLMPPEGKGTPLTALEIGKIRTWIDRGLQWTDETETNAELRHWALLPVRKISAPVIPQDSSIQNSIDAFVFDRLNREKLRHSDEADRVTLLRRVFMDLLGLPPSTDEVSEFLADSRPDAYSRLLDRAFASPHYGERWGRHWLDLARYADSDGYEKDRPRPFAWRFRNWVIDAVNADMPFDQFTREQLAGDLLNESSLTQKTAVGFHRNTLHNTEGGADQEEDRVKKTVDRTNTLGTVWLGMTVGCAQCHSHKYDPITQREYYSLYAFFDSLSEVDVDAPTRQDIEKLDRELVAHRAKEADLLTALQNYEREKLEDSLKTWEEQNRSVSSWLPLDVSEVKSTFGAKFSKQNDGSWLVAGENKLSDTYVIRAKSSLKRIAGLRLEVLPDPALPGNGPGRSKNGNFVLAEIAIATPGIASSQIPLKKAVASFSQNKFDVRLAINKKADDGWAVSPKIGQRHVAVFELERPLEGDNGIELTLTLDQTYKGPDPHNVGRFLISATDNQEPLTLEGPTPAVMEILAVARENRTEAQKTKLVEFFKAVDPEHRRLHAALKDHQAKQPKLPADKKIQSVAELSKPRPTRIQIRGDFLSPGDPVEPTTFRVLPPLKSRGSRPDRIDLANWLFDPTHPLTARVAANRIWMQCFGRGLVPTVDDFGKQGDPPSHPELLDFLAAEFRDGGWSTKQLHRTILLSATYRQSSKPREDLQAVDPENSLFGRQIRRRVEAEIIRDLALSVSGLLDRRVGGPSVRPPQPGDYSNLTYANSAKWATSAGGDAYRRGMYTFYQRTSPYPMLATFDAPDSTETCTRRVHSNTPLQSLTLWNDPVFFEMAQSFARRIVKENVADPDSGDLVKHRVNHAFRLCVGRSPQRSETEALVSLYEDQLRENRRDPAATVSIIGQTKNNVPATDEELAAWVIVARTLLNLDEFITRE